MKWLRRYNESRTIKATDGTIKEILHEEINKLGSDADLNHIDVSRVTHMNYLFYGSPFNGDISLWNVENVRDMYNMFNKTQFNGDISNWNVGNVIHITGMFKHSQFNGDISNWNVGNVENMGWMFYYSSFNNNLSRWNVRNVQNMSFMFLFSPLDGREPWWYVLSPIFKGDNYSMFDSMDFGWIDLERKIIYKNKLISTLKRSYNKEWNAQLPPIREFTYQ